MNRLYKAPQTTMRTAQQNNMYHQPSYGGVLLDDAGVGMKSGTRRRRRGSFNSNMAQTSAHEGNNRHATAMDMAPSVVARQDSDDGSLGTMALTIAADRDHHPHSQYIDIDMIPPIPILWDDQEPAPSSNHRNRNHPSASPYVSKRKGIMPPEIKGVHKRKSPNTGQPSHKKNTTKSRDHNSNGGSNRALRYGHEDFSEAMEDSYGGCDFSDHSNSHDERKSNTSKSKGSFWRFLRRLRAESLSSYNQHFSWIHLAQVTILLILAIYVYDSHNKVQSHRDQLREYDQERSQILEQMMWIDKAAKKVHKKFAEQDPSAASVLGLEPSAVDIDADGGERPDGNGQNNIYQEALREAEDTLDQIHHAIQLNARSHLASTFGDSPAEVSLQVSDDKTVLIALSDDTPHAISTLVQQVSGHLWDQIKVLSQDQDVSDNTEAFMGRLQLIGRPSDPSTTTSPLLEFVERSHGCREVGSVSLRQQKAAHLDGVGSGDAEAMDAAENPFRLVLIVNLDPQVSSLPKGEVCIGSVLKGLDTLVQLRNKR